MLAWTRETAVSLLEEHCTRGLLLLQSVLQVEQLLREAGAGSRSPYWLSWWPGWRRAGAS